MATTKTKKKVTKSVDEEENPHGTRGIEDMENLMLINPEPGIGEGTGQSKQEPHTDPVDKLYRMNEEPEPIGPHNMSNSTPNIHNRLTDKDVYNLVSKNTPSSRLRNI